MKQIGVLEITAAVGFFMGGCLISLGEAQAQTPQRGGTAILTITQDPTSLNPDVTTNLPDRTVGCIPYQGLVQVSSDYKILPLLAKSWTISPDGLTYDFDLKTVDWQDGKPFTSEDVKHSLLEVSTKYSAVFGPSGRLIETIATPAKDKVVIKLKQPFGPFLISLACEQGAAIVPSHLFAGTNPLTNPASITAPVGTGAFLLSEWKRGDYLRLKKNPKYYEPGKPYLDEIVVKPISQPAAAMRALQAGEVDLVQQFLPSEQAAVKANPKLKVMVSDVAPLMSFIFFNTARKPLDDKRVRQALAMATDRDYLIKNAFFDVGSVGVMPITTDIPWASNPDVDFRKMYPFDPAKANALLDEAGVKRDASGKRFAIRMTTFSTQYLEFQQVAAAAKSMWQAVGVDVSIEGLEDATLMKRVFQDRDFDVFPMTYTTYADPALGVARVFVSSSIGKPYGNPTNYVNTTVDSLFEKGERATSLDERGKFYKEAQMILATELPTLTIRQYKALDAASVRLQGLWGVTQGTGNWASAWLAN